MNGKIDCSVCGKDLAGLDVEYHYSRNHGHVVEVPREVLLLSLRESNETIARLRELLEKARELAAMPTGYYEVGRSRLPYWDGEQIAARIAALGLSKRG